MGQYQVVPWDAVTRGPPPGCCFDDCTKDAVWSVLRLTTSVSGKPLDAWCNEHLPAQDRVGEQRR